MIAESQEEIVQKVETTEDDDYKEDGFFGEA